MLPLTDRRSRYVFSARTPLAFSTSTHTDSLCLRLSRADGSAYVADMCNSIIRKINVTSGFVSSVYHKMKYPNEENFPEAHSNLALLPDGRLLVSTYWRRAVIYVMKLDGCNKLDPSGQICDTEIVAGDQYERGYHTSAEGGGLEGEGSNAKFGAPKGIAASPDGATILVTGRASQTQPFRFATGMCDFVDLSAFSRHLQPPREKDHRGRESSDDPGGVSRARSKRGGICQG